MSDMFVCRGCETVGIFQTVNISTVQRLPKECRQNEEVRKKMEIAASMTNIF